MDNKANKETINDRREKRLSGTIPSTEHSLLMKKLKRLGKNRKVSIPDFIVACIRVSDEIVQPYIDEVVDKKYGERKMLIRNFSNLSPEAQKQIEEILAREAKNKSA